MTTATGPRDYTSGWILFAATLASVVGVFNLIYGVTLLFNSEWVVLTTSGLLMLDVTSWGWILVILGLVQLGIAYGIATGQTWARVMGVLWASISAIGQMAFLSVYPVWSILIIAVDVLVIYGLTVHGDEVAAA